MADRDEDEVEIKRYDNALAAEMALDFLREHDVPARLKGTGTSNVLDRFTLVVDLRLMVRRRDHEAALEAMEAYELDDSQADEFAQRQFDDDADRSEHAYRARRANAQDEGAARQDVRYKRAAIVGIAWFGGAHLNARQSVLGWFLFVTMWALWIGSSALQRPWMAIAFGLLLIYDIAHGVIAVDAYNAGRRSTAQTQLVHGLSVLLVASLAGMALAAVRPPRSPQPEPETAPIPAR